MFFLLSMAFAGPLRLSPSPEADVQLLPTVQAGRAELIVYDNLVDLRPQIKNHRFDGIRRIWATDTGDVWVINMIFDKPNTSLRLERGTEGWTGKVLAQPAQDSLFIKAPTLADIAAGKATAPVCPAPKLSIRPLSGEDLSYGMLPQNSLPQLARWTEAEPTAISWDEVQALRSALFVHHEQLDAATALYRLGALHRELGHAREAAYYFGEANTKGGNHALILLQQAGALLAAHRWEDARTITYQAWQAGAPEDEVLEVLGVIALATHDPQSNQIALALAGATARPTSLALAGSMLMQVTCPEQAIPILEKAIKYLRRSDQPRTAQSRLMLADALILMGRLDDADNLLAILSDRDIPEDWAGVLKARSRLVALLRQTPDRWAAMVPSLDAFRNGIDSEAAESLFLLGQIDEWMGDDRSAIEIYQNILEHHRRLQNGEPAKRLLASWVRRSAELVDAGNMLDALSLHTAVWRPSFTELQDNPEPLRPLAEGYRQLGLYYRAMSVLGTMAEIEGRTHRDDQLSILSIAEVYLEMGHPDLATDALAVLKDRKQLPGIAGRTRLLEGRIAHAKGDFPAARQLWAQAMASTDVAAEAQTRIAILDAEAGACPAALPGLTLGLDTPSVRTTLGEGLLRALRTDCLSKAANPEGAAVEARQAALSLQDAKLKRFATHLSIEESALAGINPPGQPIAPTPPDIWTLLESEEVQNTAFEARLQAARK